MDKTVLVTGSTGWIGKHCCPILREKGYRVQPFIGDLLMDHGFLPSANYLLHLAWDVTPGSYWESPMNIEWYENSLKFFQTFKEDDGKRIVVAGTCAEEITKSLYGRSKNALRQTLEVYSDITGISSAWGRIFYLYGPHERPERLIPSIIISLLQGKEFTIQHTDQMIDLFHVDDVASALVSILNSNVTGTVEIGNGKPITLHVVGQYIAEIIGRTDLLKFGDIPMPKYIAADITRLRDEVKWSPKYDIYTGLMNTIEWWKKQIMKGAIQEGSTE